MSFELIDQDVKNIIKIDNPSSDLIKYAIRKDYTIISYLEPRYLSDEIKSYSIYHNLFSLDHIPYSELTNNTLNISLRNCTIPDNFYITPAVYRFLVKYCFIKQDTFEALQLIRNYSDNIFMFDDFIDDLAIMNHENNIFIRPINDIEE